MRPSLTPYLELPKPEIALVAALSSAGGFVPALIAILVLDRAILG